MPFPQTFHSGQTVSRKRAAFTLTELLVVLAVVVLLACVRLPALARVKSQTWITQCSANQKQIGLSSLLYGNDNNGQLYSSLAFFPWDLPDSIYQSFKLYTGGQSNAFYCPSNPYQSLLWNYGGTHVTGYVYTYPGYGPDGVYTGSYATNINQTINPQQQPLFGHFVVPSAAQRVLVTDTEICAGPGPYDPNAPATSHNFTSILGSPPAFPDGRYFRASHLAGQSPLGGNLGMLDGHVEWRALRSSTYSMIQRNQATTAIPIFLW